MALGMGSAEMFLVSTADIPGGGALSSWPSTQMSTPSRWRSSWMSWSLGMNSMMGNETERNFVYHSGIIYDTKQARTNLFQRKRSVAYPEVVTPGAINTNHPMPNAVHDVLCYLYVICLTLGNDWSNIFWFSVDMTPPKGGTQGTCPTLPPYSYATISDRIWSPMYPSYSFMLGPLTAPPTHHPLNLDACVSC